MAPKPRAKPRKKSRKPKAAPAPAAASSVDVLDEQLRRLDAPYGDFDMGMGGGEDEFGDEGFF